MKTLLDELYDYDLFHLTEIEDTDGVYKATLDRIVKAETELKKTIQTAPTYSMSINQQTLICTISATAMSFTKASRSAHSLSLK